MSKVTWASLPICWRPPLMCHFLYLEPFTQEAPLESVSGQAGEPYQLVRATCHSCAEQKGCLFQKKHGDFPKIGVWERVLNPVILSGLGMSRDVYFSLQMQFKILPVESSIAFPNRLGSFKWNAASVRESGERKQ